MKNKKKKAWNDIEKFSLHLGKKVFSKKMTYEEAFNELFYKIHNFGNRGEHENESK